MRSLLRTPIIWTAALACLLGPANVSGAADWPQWGGGDARNMVSLEVNLPQSFKPGRKKPSGGGIDMATTENVLWASRLGSTAYGNATVAGGRVFVGTNDLTLNDDSRFQRSQAGLLQCFDEATGQLVWRLVTPKRDRLPADIHFSHQHLGVCSSPTVHGDRVYIVGSGGDILCVDVNGLADGNDGPFTDEAQYMAGEGKPPVELMPLDADIVWRFDPIDEAAVYPHDAASCSVLIHGDVLYVGTSNGVDGPHARVLNPEAPSLIALDKRDGRLLAVDGAGIGRRMYHCQWSSPSLGEVDGRTLIFFGGGDGICYAFEPFAPDSTGDTSVRVPDSDPPLLVPGGPKVWPAPARPHWQGGKATDPSSGEPATLKLVWFYDCNPPEWKFRDGKEVPFYEGDRRKSYSTNDNDGQYTGPNQIIATPVFHEGRVYVTIGQDPAHGRGRGMLHCIDASGSGDITKSGRVWAYEAIERSMSTPVVCDGLVYAADVFGHLHCLDADSGKVHWIYESRTETWGGPLAADGRLYFGTKRELIVLAQGDQLELLDKINLGSPAYSTPIAANGVLFVASQQYLWAVRKTGQGE